MLPAHSPARSALLLSLLSGLALAGPLLAGQTLWGQTLARPGWTGSGLTVEPWWTHAVLYAVDPHRVGPPADRDLPGLKGIIRRLDAIRSLGVDGITLAHLEGSDPAAHAQAIDPTLGTLDDLDDLLREASRDNLHVLIELDPAAADPNAAARLWLQHGAAGISLRVPAPAEHTLHQLIAGFPGHRILVAPLDAATPREAELSLAPPLDITLPLAELRHALTALQATSGAGLLARTVPATKPEAAKVLATLLLATHANAELVYGQEIGQEVGRASDFAAREADPDSLLNWYRRLIDLHHGSAALRSGTNIFLDHDAENALVWVNRRPQVNAQTPAVVVACNLSASPLKLKLTDDLARLQLRGTFLRPVLRSGPAMGGQSIDAVTLPPFGVYIGELRF